MCDGSEEKAKEMTIVVQPAKPEVLPAVRNGEPSDARVKGLDLDRMLRMLTQEMNVVEKLEGSLSALEELILGTTDTLKGKNDEELLEIYKAIMSRKHSSQQFVLRVMELGIKTDFMAKLLDLQRTKPAERPIGKPSQEMARVKSILQQQIDNRIAEQTPK